MTHFNKQDRIVEILIGWGFSKEDALLSLGIDPNETDSVDHPGHYETGAPFECIDVMIETQGTEAVKSFCVCNAFKYLYRHRRKNGDEDVRKAKWYIDKYLELEE